MVAIRSSTEDDIEALHRALDSVARERRYLALLEAPPLEKLREFVTSGLARMNVHIVAADGADIVGWCDITRLERDIMTHVGALGMGLLPDYRGKGLGRRLIEEALRTAWERDFKRVELTVYSDNPRAIALYERVGFTKEGVLTNRARIDRRYIAMIFMAMLHGDAPRAA